jgi:hypothetical protein
MRNSKKRIINEPKMFTSFLSFMERTADTKKIWFYRPAARADDEPTRRDEEG